MENENTVKCMTGLTTVNVELTSRCNKNCWMCGRRKIDRDYPEIKMNYGDMDLDMAINISHQLPKGIVVQFHSNGEPLLYEHLGIVLGWYHNQIRCLDTNGKLLLEKADKIIGNMETLTISVIENDDEGDEQYRIVKKFLKVKGDRQPLMIYRLLGDVSYIGDDSKYHNPMHNEKNRDRWYKLPGIIATRTLHNPMGSFKYEKKITVPEIGICLDLLNHLVIDKDGDVFTCVRFNPKKYNLLGNVRDKSLYSMWNGPQRQSLIQEHIKGNRKCSKLCEKCEFYGCPIG